MIEFAESIRVDFSFFSAPAGAIYQRIKGTYARNICDCCGKPRACDYYEWKQGDKAVFMDLCRECKKEHAEVVA